MIQSEFSRYEPTAEDEYFFEQQLRLRRLKQESEQAGRQRAAEPSRGDAQAEQPGPIWRRIIRALTGRANTDWRP